MNLGVFGGLCLIIGFPILLVWSNRRRMVVEREWEEELKTCSPERRKEILDIKASIKKNDEWGAEQNDKSYRACAFGDDDWL